VKNLAKAPLSRRIKLNPVMFAPVPAETACDLEDRRSKIASAFADL
jgi:hypothetical protein